MSNERRYTGAEKVGILREHLLEKVPLSEVCSKHGVTPGMFEEWQKKLFKQGAIIFDSRASQDRQKRDESRLINFFKLVHTPRLKNMEILRFLLSRSNEFSDYPILYDAIGPDGFMKFLNIFEGTTFTVLPIEELDVIIRDIDIYIRVSRKNDAYVINDVANGYKLTSLQVRKIAATMDAQLKDFKSSSNVSAT